MGYAEPDEFKMSASPKKHGTRQPVVKLTASSATSNSPVARALFQLETQGVPLEGAPCLDSWSSLACTCRTKQTQAWSCPRMHEAVSDRAKALHMLIRSVTRLCAGAEERRQRFKTAGKAGNADSDAKVAEGASEVASKAAISAASVAAAAKADADAQKSDEVHTAQPTSWPAGWMMQFLHSQNAYMDDQGLPHLSQFLMRSPHGM